MPSYFYKNIIVTLHLKKFGATNGVVRFFSHGQTNSKGVTILFSHKITFDIVNVKQDTDGRFLLIECNIFGENYILVNIYAPTGDKSKIISEVSSLCINNENLSAYLDKISIP